MIFGRRRSPSGAANLSLALLALLGLGSCSDAEPDVGLSGTLYALRSPADPLVVARVDLATGQVLPVPGAPDYASTISAPGDGSFLILSTGEILKFDLESSATTLVMGQTDTANIAGAVVSPDGRRVAYSRSTRAGTAVLVRELGSGTDIVAFPPTMGDAPTSEGWLDDTTLVFIRSDSVSPGTPRLWSVRADGTGLGPLGGDTGTVAGVVSAHPPSRRLLLFISDAETRQFWIADASGRLQRRVATVDRLDPFYPFASWSPDGRHVALCSATPTSDSDLLILTIQNGGLDTLTSDPGFECQPLWVP